MPGLADADPVPVVLSHLRQHTGLLAEVGGDADNITGIVEAPWPHVRIATAPGGDLRDMRWAAETAVLIEVFGDPAGKTGEAKLRRIAFTVLEAVKELEGADAAPGKPFIARVSAADVPASVPLTTGQRKWSATLRLVARPPR